MPSWLIIIHKIYSSRRWFDDISVFNNYLTYQHLVNCKVKSSMNINSSHCWKDIYKNTCNKSIFSSKKWNFVTAWNICIQECELWALFCKNMQHWRNAHHLYHHATNLYYNVPNAYKNVLSCSRVMIKIITNQNLTKKFTSSMLHRYLFK